MCKEMPVIPVNRMVDQKNGGPRRLLTPPPKKKDGNHVKGWRKAWERTILPGREAISHLTTDGRRTLHLNPWVSLRSDQLISPVNKEVDKKISNGKRAGGQKLLFYQAQ
jgi:hypothetical protein